MPHLVELYRQQGDILYEGKLLSHHLIESHIGLTISYARRSGYKDPELLGWLYLSLVESVNKAKTHLVDNNLTRYIIANFRSGLRKFREGQATVRSAYRKGLVTQSLMEHPRADALGDLLELKEMMECVCLDELDSAILELSLQSYTYKEISDILSIRKNNLKYRLKKMRHRCRVSQGNYPSEEICIKRLKQNV